jgi:hypothetical protein
MSRMLSCTRCYSDPIQASRFFRPCCRTARKGGKGGPAHGDEHPPRGEYGGAPRGGSVRRAPAPHVPDGGATGAGQRGGQALAPRGGRSCHAVAPQRGPALQGAGLSAVLRTAAVSGSGRRRPTRRSGIPKRVSGHGCGACSPPSTGVPPSGSQMKRSALSSAPWPR